MSIRSKIVFISAIFAVICSGSLFAASSKKSKAVKVLLEDGKAPLGFWISGYGGGSANKAEVKGKLAVEATLNSFKEKMVCNFNNNKPLDPEDLKDIKHPKIEVEITAKAKYDGKLTFHWMNGADVSSTSEAKVILPEGKSTKVEFDMPEAGANKITGYAIGCSKEISFTMTKAIVVKGKK
ncbi:MAG: hypothetical protein JXR97_12785 [Planctomycetes bacterium]|nr:hypothetical protein [Planctomycetota bacterium]